MFKISFYSFSQNSFIHRAGQAFDVWLIFNNVCRGSLNYATKFNAQKYCFYQSIEMATRHLLGNTFWPASKELHRINKHSCHVVRILSNLTIYEKKITFKLKKNTGRLRGAMIAQKTSLKDLLQRSREEIDFSVPKLFRSNHITMT